MVNIAVKNKKNKKTKKQEQAVDLLRNKWAYYFLLSFIFILLLFHSQFPKLGSPLWGLRGSLYSGRSVNLITGPAGSP